MWIIDWIGHGTLGCLGLFSVLSWSMIIERFIHFKKAWTECQDMHLMLKTQDLIKIYEKSRRWNDDWHGCGTIFLAGFREFNRPNQANDSMMQCVMEESRSWVMQQREAYVTGLATIASVSPYIGLLGTVAGIMKTFQSIGLGGQASHMASVAPGLSEALIATAIGLITTIPASIAYNRYVQQLEHLSSKYEHFEKKSLALLRHLLSEDAQKSC